MTYVGDSKGTNESGTAASLTPFRIGMGVAALLLVLSYEAVVKPALAEKNRQASTAAQSAAAERLRWEIDKLRSEKERNIAALGVPPHDADLAAELLEVFGRFEVKLTHFESRAGIAMSPFHGVPIKAALEGDFEKLVTLLNALETDGRPLWIESVAMKRTEKSPETLTLQLQLIGLSQGEIEKNKRR